MTELVPNIHALLIGIDYYKPNLLFKSLKGAVRDINLVDTYLRETLKVSENRICKLISPNREDIALLDARSAQDKEPTYENIVNAFNEITEQVRSGEQVYIHYSGHGGRATTIYPELKGDGQNDEGIVPMDLSDTEGRYLRDVELATLLKRLTDKGAIVTVILDSCHSGGATRGDCDIRGSNQEDRADRPKDSLVDSRENLIDNWRSLTEGKSHTAWVPESRDYVLLAACRPTEVAFEYAVDGLDRHGALTYWMINILRTVPGIHSYKTLYDCVSAKIQSRFREQLPMLLGEGDRTLFGSDILANQYTVTVLDTDIDRNQVKLSAGRMHGLGRGTRFAIYPLNTSDFSDKQKQLAIVEVTEVAVSTASAKILDEADGGIGTKGEVLQGLPAVLLAAPADLKRRVRLFDQKTLGDAEHELPTRQLVAAQSRALLAVRQALAENGWLIEVSGNEEGHYQVAIGRNEEYEICTGLPIKNLNPPLKIGHAKAPAEVVKRLVHLAKYQSVQELDNPASELAKYLDFELLDQDKQPFPDPQNIILQHGSLTYLRIKNRFVQSLNVGVLDLEPTWEISQIKLRGIDGPFYELAPQEDFNTPLRFSIPENQEYRQAKEVLKLFATRGTADFRWLRLPSLDQPIQAHRGTMRSSNSAFGTLLAAVGEDPDRAPSLTRAATYEPDPDADWATKQIQLTIKR